MEENRVNDRSKKLLVLLLIILSLMLGIMSWLYFDLKSEKEVLVIEITEATSQKEDLQSELSTLLADYENLQTDNDSLSVELVANQEKIKALIEEVKNVKATNYAKIKALKKEMDTLREIMRGFVVQIDSLNTLNQHLIAENVKVKTDYDSAQVVNRELSATNNDLSAKVQKASVIKTINIAATPLNKRSNPTDRVSKVEKVKVCFTLTENVIARNGSKDVYIRIARPDELVITESEEDLFTFQGDKLAYTSKRQVDYQNEDIDLCIYWDNNQDLIPGVYYVDIFADGNQIGTTTFTLK